MTNRKAPLHIHAYPFLKDGSFSMSDAPLRSIIEQMPGLHWTSDQNLRITANWGMDLASARIPPDGLVGLSVWEFLPCTGPHTTPIAEHYEALRGFPSQFEYYWKNRFWEIRLDPLRAPSGEISGCLGSGMDITARKKNEEQAVYQSRHDALTGLANYREFMDRLEHEVRRAERSHHSFSLLLLDLDGLKRINDLPGHLAGNRALQRLAAGERTLPLHRPRCAYGGDEFVCDDRLGQGHGRARRPPHRERPAYRQGKLYRVSIGIGIYPEDGRTALSLIEAADQQLYKYKRTHRIFRAHKCE
jgi:diguanylate cyclase (GGDEF)-like protein